MSLRAETIKLAKANPKLRHLLLPLLGEPRTAKKADEDEADDGEKESKFEKGEDVPVSALPKALQKNVKDPPPSVQKVKEKIKSKKGSPDYDLFLATVKVANTNPEMREKLAPVLVKYIEADSSIPGDAPNASDERANGMGWDPGNVENAGDANEPYPVYNPGIGLGKGAGEIELLAQTIKLASSKPELEDKLLPTIREAMVLPFLDGEIKTADKWEKMPKGWTNESRKKFWGTLTGGAPKHKVTACMKKMEGKVSNTGAFCASLADRVLGTTKWRGDRDASERLANDDEFISIEEVRSLCPSCAEKMASYNLKSVKASVLRKVIEGSKK